MTRIETKGKAVKKAPAITDLFTNSEARAIIIPETTAFIQNITAPHIHRFFSFIDIDEALDFKSISTQPKTNLPNITPIRAPKIKRKDVNPII